MEFIWTVDAGAESTKNKRAHAYTADEGGNAFQLCGGEYVKGPADKRNPKGRVKLSSITATQGQKSKNCLNVYEKLTKKNPLK